MPVLICISSLRSPKLPSLFTHTLSTSSNADYAGKGLHIRIIIIIKYPNGFVMNGKCAQGHMHVPFVRELMQNGYVSKTIYRYNLLLAYIDF